MTTTSVPFGLGTLSNKIKTYPKATEGIFDCQIEDSFLLDV